MTESFHESAAHERDRSFDGLIEVVYSDDHSIVLDIAEETMTSLVSEGSTIQYEELVTRDGYILEPFTIFNWEEVVRFGTELEPVIVADGKTALQSRRHTSNLEFLSLVQNLRSNDIDTLEVSIRKDHEDDSIEYAMLHRLLKDQKYDLWVRLESRRTVRGAASQPVVARLEYIGFSGDKLTMIPHIKNSNGHQIDYIPEALTLGHPWLYVGVDYNREPDEE